MKKILGISLVAMMAVTAANAEIASKAYVNQQDTAAIATAGTNADTKISTAIGTLGTREVGGQQVAYPNVKTYVDEKVAGAAGDASAAVAALDATESQTAGTDGLSLTVTQENGLITGISGSIAANTYDAHGAAAGVRTYVGEIPNTSEATSVIGYVDEQVSSAVSDDAVNSVSLASGTNNGTVKLTVDGVDTDNIAVTGLGSAAFTASTAYDAAGSAAAAQTAAEGYTDAAIAGLDAAVSNTVGADGLSLSVTEVDGVITAVSGSIAANTYDAYGAASGAVGALDYNSAEDQNAGTGVVVNVTETDGVVAVSKADPLTTMGYDTLGVDEGDGKYALTAVVTNNVITGYKWELIERASNN